ncbi:hypothetical protein BASA62_007465 [Batrachochytrium salamandrivorans]|nr:hypothetical protein BASA62_007465 [Batrachochytrium salamandrivorans]
MFNFILVFILPLSLSSCVVSTPVSAGRHELVHVYRRSVDMNLPFYYPEPNYDNNPVWTGGSSFSGSDNSDPVAAGIQYMASKLNVNQDELKVYNRFTDASGTVHIYGAQPKRSVFRITVRFEITKEYVHLPGGNVVYAYMLQLRDGNIEKWLQVWVDAQTGQVIHSIDFSNDFSYKANNVNARDQRSGAPGRGSNGVFDSNHNPDAQPTTPDNVQASAVNLFYIGNFMHDFSYQYGFTEATVHINRYHNEMAALTNVIPAHEYVHGISNRLTGGSATGQCLSTKEAGALGVFARIPTALIPKSTHSNSAIFNAVTKYMILVKCGQYLLWEVYWNLVNKNGFSENLFDAKQSAGNIVAMQLIMGGMMNQPCNPTFLTARDAILKADDSFYKGANKCDIISGFARRGLGLGARNRIDDFSVPAECGGSGKNIPPPVPTGDNDGASKLPTDQSGDDNGRLPTTGQTPGGGTNRTGRGPWSCLCPVGRTGRGGPVDRTGRGGPVDRTGRGRGPIGPISRGRGPRRGRGRGRRLTSRLGDISRLGGSIDSQVSQMLKEFESDK